MTDYWKWRFDSEGRYYSGGDMRREAGPPAFQWRILKSLDTGDVRFVEENATRKSNSGVLADWLSWYLWQRAAPQKQDPVETRQTSNVFTQCLPVPQARRSLSLSSTSPLLRHLRRSPTLYFERCTLNGNLNAVSSAPQTPSARRLTSTTDWASPVADRFKAFPCPSFN